MRQTPLIRSVYGVFAALLSTLVAMATLTGCDANTSSAGSTNPGPATSVPSGVLQGSQSWQEALASTLPDGVQALVIEHATSPLLLLALDPLQVEPVLVAAPGSGLAASAALSQYNLKVLVGSGFVAELHSLQPVGLLQVDGETLNPVEGHGYTRILGIRDQGRDQSRDQGRNHVGNQSIGVVHKDAYQRNLFHSAMQVGPGIIEEGLLDISERDLERPKYFRSIVAVCEARWVVGVSLQPAHLYTLGQTLLEVFDEQGWQCSEVVNLAGDREAVAMLQSQAGKIYHGDPDTYKASLLGFRPRS